MLSEGQCFPVVSSLHLTDRCYWPFLSFWRYQTCKPAQQLGSILGWEWKLRVIGNFRRKQEPVMSWDKGSVMSHARQIGCWDVGSSTCKTHDISCLFFYFPLVRLPLQSCTHSEHCIPRKMGTIGKIQSKVKSK